MQVITDIHGRDTWKKLNPEIPTVFLGDYVDSFDISAQKQIRNILEIIQLKKDHPHIILLWGNHDMHYAFPNDFEKCSGYQDQFAGTIRKIFQENLDLFKYIHVVGDTIYSHAGITKTWLDRRPVDKINEFPPRYFDFRGYEPTGDSVVNGPMWVRPASLTRDAIEGYRQVVGHTPIKKQEGTILFCGDFGEVLDITEESW